MPKYKLCSYNCVYCEIGPTYQVVSPEHRIKAPPSSNFRKELKDILKYVPHLDSITLGISFNYLIKVDNKKKLQGELTNVLVNLKKICINQSIIMHPKKKRLNQKIFRSIEAELSKFENIKDTSDYQIVTKFMYDVLRLIPFYSENLLKYQIKLMYP
ncbi:MAG: hypothetical protein E3J83_04505 [Candidatus Atribacteria bacterium]|nr:MAG: hypothetical protein E3J83_04505 [Candidatus Atribacteria bacterium]